MELMNVCVIIGVVLGFYVFVRRFNEIWYLFKLGRKLNKSLPPGDLGWPFVGSTFSFYKAFKVEGDPYTFIHTLLLRYGRVGMYKSHLYGMPTIIVTNPEICRRIYLDDERFEPNYPKSVKILETNGDFSKIDHKSGYKIMASPMNGSEVLSKHVEFIEQTVEKGLEEWSSMRREPIELVDEIGGLLFKIILHIFLGNEIDGQAMAELHTLYKELGLVIMSFLPYDLPGFTYRRALKARKKIEKILHCVIEKKRKRFEKDDGTNEVVHCQVDKLIVATNENGSKPYNNSTIIDLILGIFFAGHNTPAIAAMWALLHISQNPHIFQMAKEEQESIIRQRPSTQKGLTFQEIKQMKYLTKFINEVLRRNTVAPTNFRKARTYVNINGYTIPKGWTVQIWSVAIHMDSQIYSNSQEFDPSRWDNYTPKPGEFIPFGLGSRFCPGSELAKLEITILLHHFILNYKMELVDQNCKVTHLPSPKPRDNCLCKIIRVS
ncbi:beta-amyrin 11-oxidase [Cucumis sativus]|uniref:beta-amyrin 11-oxidase n=1 Tax=Cucumis sativus TaxID=3659 RepID=UPI0002B470BF|nr:beta-amyrin 11-oxidase [Cucumis sativus]